nr:MAG TPA: Lysis protein [Caudoviricetes sp.]
MKKLLITSAVLLTATFTLAACSSNQSATKDSSDQPKTEQSEAKETKASEKPASKKATSLDDFKKALEDNGFTIKEEISKEASLIQAESGKGFILEDDTAVEVYEYYDKNPMFKEAKKEKELIGHPAYIYGNYVVLVLNSTDSKDKILDSFKGFE